MQTIKVSIPPKGPVKIETEGFQGQACLRATANLKRALGGDESEYAEKPEMHAVTDTVAN